MEDELGFLTLDPDPEVRVLKYKKISRKIISYIIRRKVFNFEMVAIRIFCIGIVCLLCIFLPGGSKTGESFLISIGTGLIAGDVLLLVGGVKAREMDDQEEKIKVTEKNLNAINRILRIRHIISYRKCNRDNDTELAIKIIELISECYDFRNSNFHNKDCVQQLLRMNLKINEDEKIYPETVPMDFSKFHKDIYIINDEIKISSEVSLELLEKRFNEIDIFLLQLEKIHFQLGREYSRLLEEYNLIKRNSIG